MILNGSLAGLVVITAGCANITCLGASVIGITSAIPVVVELLDNKRKIDDPVGTVGVHCTNAIFSTIAVGLFDYILITILFVIIKWSSICICRLCDSLISFPLYLRKHAAWLAQLGTGRNLLAAFL